MAPILTTHARLERLFLHFFDIHFIEDRGQAAKTDLFRREMLLATRLAIASADTVFIPAASFFESKLCKEIVGSMDELLSLGIIALSGSSANLEEFVRERIDGTFYRSESLQSKSYSTWKGSTIVPPYLSRKRSATRDIIDHWGRKVSNEELARMLRDAAGSSIEQLERRLERVPSELGGLAFIPEHVYDVLDLGQGTSVVHARIRSVINEAYFNSYVRDLDSGVVVDLKYLASDFAMPSRGRNLSYTKMVRFLQGRNRLTEVLECSQSQLVQLGSDPAWQEALQTAVTYAGIESSYASGEDGSGSIARRGGPNGHGSLTAKTRTNRTRLEGVCVLCIAAAAIEFSAVRDFLDGMLGIGEIVSLGLPGTDYAVKYCDLETGSIWYLAGLSFQGQVEAAVRTQGLSIRLHPTITLMIGMCMGMPSRRLDVGTVIVPNEIFSFDHQRITSTGTQYRPHGDRVDNGIYKLARIVGSSSHLGYQVIADKALASANVKVENVDSELIHAITKTIPDAIAFDMEGWGFYRSDQFGLLWIKAVADSGEAQGNAESDRDKKRNTQAKVTANAADFAVNLVRQFVRVAPDAA